MRVLHVVISMLLLAGCGGDQVCQDATCAVGGKSYQTCATPGTADLQYKFGDDGCACNAGTDCTSCADKLTQFCTGTGVGGSGNGGSGGSGGGGSGGIGGGGSGGSGGGGSGGIGGGGSGGSGGGGGSNGTCAMGGGACQSFSDCCSGTCAAQICTSCQPSGAACVSSQDCCSGATCYNSVCSNNCQDDNTTCTLASQCCSNICAQGNCQQCTAASGPCSTSAECCNGTTCNGGFCSVPETVGECTSMASALCLTCCGNSEPDGAAQLFALEQQCACSASTCATACAVSLCAATPTTADAACTTCLAQSCVMPVLTPCEAETSCALYVQCAEGCPTT